jgi:magnesium chelatase family protein
VRRYRAKLSGPLLDRFDITVEVPAVDPQDLASTAPGEASSHVRDRVHAARLRQRARFGAAGPAHNARMERADLERHASLGPSPKRLLIEACRRLGVTARGYDRVRRVARTLADLDASDPILDRHVAEAVQYRPALSS